jgi:23S rRNA pseudouridine2605 synthase
MPLERLQKVLAAAGVASRRECEHVILDGRVRVNGEVVAKLPVLVDPERDRITVDGQPLGRERKVYYLLHKPPGVHCTNYDPDNRTRAVDLLPGVKERVYSVGRLDADSSGLLLMTNDGDLAEHLTHPRYGVAKTYRAHVSGRITPDDIEQMRRGVWLAEGKAQVASAKIIHADARHSVVEITLREGRNREVRRILARLRHTVRRLIRIRIGPLSLRGLPVGRFRPLTAAELRSLRQMPTGRAGAGPLPNSSGAARSPGPPPARKAFRRFPPRPRPRRS